MKPFYTVRSISTVLLFLILAPAHAQTPAAILTDVSGAVQIVRGGKTLAARNGLKLQRGDRVVSRGGRATVFSLNGPPRKIAGGASAVVGGAAGKNLAVWRAVYNGVSRGEGSGARVAATVRGTELELLSPVASRVSGAPVLRWSNVPNAENYRVTISDDSGAAVQVQTTPRNYHALSPREFSSPARFTWQVEARAGNKPLGADATQSSWFEIATPAELAAWRAGDREIVAATTGEEQALSRAAWAASRGFRADALVLLLGVDATKTLATTPKLQAAAQKLSLSGRTLLRHVLTDSGMTKRLAALDSKPVDSATTLTTNPATSVKTPDVGLPLDGRFAVVPASARKRFGDEAGLFSIEIPHSWGAYRREQDGIALTELGPSYGGEMALSVAVAPAAKMPDSLAARVISLVRATGTDVQTSNEKNVTIKLTGGAVSVREVALAWREKSKIATKDTAKDTPQNWRGALWEWSKDGKSYLLGWSAVRGSTVEFDRTQSLLRNLLLSFSAEGRKTGITDTKPEAMHDEMKRTLALMIALNDRRSEERSQSPTPEIEELRKALESAPRDSLRRATVARDLARAAESEAWTRWNQTEDANSRAAARELWQRADALRLESYQNEVAALEDEIAQTDARLAVLRAQTPLLPFAQGHGFLLDNWLQLQALRAFHLQMLAFDRRERDAQEKWARREFSYRRAKLELAAIAPGNDDESFSRRAEIASSLESIGDVLQGRAEFARAEAHYRRAIAWRNALPATYANRGLEGPWRNLGTNAINSGDLLQAREHYLVALREIERIAPVEDAALARFNNPVLTELRRAVRAQGRATISNNLGYIAQNLGDYTLAREHYQRAFGQVESLGDDGLTGRIKKSLRARALNNIATVDSDIGDVEAALKKQDESLVYLRALSDENGLALWMNNRAGVLELRGDVDGARRAAADARTRFLALRSHKSAAFSSAFLSRLARQEGDAETAMELARESLQLARTSKDSDAVVSGTRAVAAAILVSPKPDWAQFDVLIAESFAQATRIAAPLAQSGTLGIRAQGKQKRGDIAGAEADLRAAVARLEAVRASAPGADSFSDQHSDIYERLVRLLLEQKRPDEAFDVLQRARSSQLRENLRLSSLKSPDPALQKLLDRLAVLESKLRTLRAARETALADPARDVEAIKNLEGLIAATQSEFFAVGARLKKASPAFDRALTLSPLELKKAQRSLSADTVLVQYALLEDELYVFVVTRENLKIYQPKVPSKAVLEAARAFRRHMDKAQSDARAGKPLVAPEDDAALRENLTGLYQMLIAPVAGELQNKKTLAFVPSGALYYVPLHALAKQTPQGLRFLIEDISVAYLAAGDVLSVVQTRDDESFGAGALAIGDPTGADLPQARIEARAVAQILPASQSLVGDAAQKSALSAKNLNRRVLHLAAHGVLNAAQPEASYIQLAGSGEESRLRVGEIVGLDLNRVDLVTLSACQTALGESNPSGGEISSLAQSFSSAGATSVIASLWSVEDDSTRQLMELFYRGFASGEGKAVSLQKAQIALLRKPATRHPFYWAPFELLGDWR